MIEVVRAGPLTTVQDLGRPGWAHLGVPRSGALDMPALALGNRLVGNAGTAAGLEITLGGFVARIHRAATIALTGARADLRVDGSVVPGPAVAVPAGARVEVGRARHGLRCYLAIDGGIAVDPVLGSRSTDTLSGLGPPQVRDGTRLPLGDPPGGNEPASGLTQPSSAHSAGGVVLRIDLGPRDDWFTRAAIEELCTAAYTISPRSNRVGARLAGPTLTRAVAGELPSEGLVLGAVQVPADGQPLIFLADHPTTGGYPVIGVVRGADLPLLAQARPGATVAFRGPQQRPR